MKKLYIGKISKVLDLDLYTIEVDIPGYNEALPAFPKRGEVDEPRVGDVVLLTELDPVYKSYYLWEKLKENGFIGIRARGKVLKMSEEEVTLGIFDPSDTAWYDKNDGSDPTPAPTSWIKVDSGGNIDINAEGNEKVVITGNAEVEVSGDVKITVSGGAKIEVSGDTEVTCPNVKVNASGEVFLTGGGTLKTSPGASVSPTGTGGFAAMKFCCFTGAPCVGPEISGI